MRIVAPGRCCCWTHAATGGARGMGSGNAEAWLEQAVQGSYERRPVFGALGRSRCGRCPRSRACTRGPAAPGPLRTRRACSGRHQRIALRGDHRDRDVDPGQRLFLTGTGGGAANAPAPSGKRLRVRHCRDRIERGQDDGEIGQLAVPVRSPRGQHLSRGCRPRDDHVARPQGRHDRPKISAASATRAAWFGTPPLGAEAVVAERHEHRRRRASPRKAGAGRQSLSLALLLEHQQHPAAGSVPHGGAR